MCFVIDTDSLITLKRNYPSTIFVGLWNNIEQMILNRELCSITDVKNELGKEDKSFWMTYHDLTGKFFIDVKDDSMAHEYKLEGFKVYDEEWDFGETCADPILICLCIEKDHTIITQENQRSEMRIPYVCNKLNINCMNILQFFKHQKWKF